MAIGFVKTVVIGRTTGGNAVKVAAYCSGSMLVAESVSITYDFTEKTDVDCSIILTPLVVEPSCWLMDRQQLWNKVEASEIRYDAQVCREVMIAIPRELDRQDKIDLTISHVRSSYVDRGMVADICFHDLESHNPHAHVMLTMRDLLIDPEGNIDFGNKNRSWNEKKLLKTQRLEWDELANSYLERAGIPDRIDTRSYQERGIENRLPQIHLGPAVCRMRAKGIPTARGDMYDRIEAANAVIAQQLEKIYNLNQDLANLEREIADLQSESELSIEDDTTSKNIPPSEASIQSAEESIDSPADTLENLPERIDLARCTGSIQVDPVQRAKAAKYIDEMVILTSSRPAGDVVDSYQRLPADKVTPVMVQTFGQQSLDRAKSIACYQRVTVGANMAGYPAFSIDRGPLSSPFASLSTAKESTASAYERYLPGVLAGEDPRRMADSVVVQTGVKTPRAWEPPMVDDMVAELDRIVDATLEGKVVLVSAKFPTEHSHVATIQSALVDRLAARNLDLGVEVMEMVRPEVKTAPAPPQAVKKADNPIPLLDLTNSKWNKLVTDVHKLDRQIANRVAPIAMSMLAAQRTNTFTAADGVKVEASRENNTLTISSPEGKTYLSVTFRRDESNRLTYEVRSTELEFPKELLERFEKVEANAIAERTQTATRRL